MERVEKRTSTSSMGGNASSLGKEDAFLSVKRMDSVISMNIGKKGGTRKKLLPLSVEGRRKGGKSQGSSLAQGKIGINWQREKKVSSAKKSLEVAPSGKKKREDRLAL